MDLAGLRTFLAVASERSFSRAAAKLYRSQPAVSLAIRRLEDELGEPLFDRSARGGKLTEAGAILQQYGPRVMELVDEAVAAVRGANQRPEHLAIGAQDEALAVLVPLLRRFRARQAEARVEVRPGTRTQLLVQMSQGALDCAVMLHAPMRPGFSSAVMCADELILVLHPTHRLARRSSVTLTDLRDLPLIVHDASTGEDGWLPFPLKRPGSAHLSLPTLDAVKQLVRLNAGVAVMPRSAAEADVRAGHLRAARLQDVDGTLTWHLVRPDRTPSASASAFIQLACDASASTEETEISAGMTDLTSRVRAFRAVR